MAVKFAVGSQRQLLQHGPAGRHQGVRQLAGQGLAQGFHSDARLQHQTGMQLIAAILTGHADHGRLPHAGQAPQRSADFAGFDPVTTDFHLIIAASQVFQAAVIQPSHPIAATIQACTGCAERVRHIALGRQSRASRIALGNTGAAQVQLAGDAVTHRVEPGIQHPGFNPGQRCADGQGAGAQAIGMGGVLAQRTHRGLGGAVMVEHAQVRGKLANLLQQLPGSGFAAQDQCVPWQHPGRVTGVEQGLQMTGGDFQHVGPLFALPMGKGVGVEGLLIGGQVQHTTLAQGAEQHRMAEVGGHRRNQREAAVRRQLQTLAQPRDIGGQVAATGNHGLGRTTGTGGVDQVRGQLRHVARPGRHRRGQRQIRLQRQPVQTRHPGVRPQYQARTAVSQHHRAAFGRPARVHWHIGGTTLECCQNADHQPRRTPGQ